MVSLELTRVRISKNESARNHVDGLRVFVVINLQLPIKQRIARAFYEKPRDTFMFAA